MVVDGEQFISHLVPSGILQGKTCLLGNGMVVDPEVLVEELDNLNNKGIDVGPDRLKISEKAHIIMPYHKHIDLAADPGKGWQIGRHHDLCDRNHDSFHPIPRRTLQDVGEIFLQHSCNLLLSVCFHDTKIALI